MRTSVFALGAISLAASLAFATPASATSTVAVNGACSNMTDGVASSCHFSGNITTGTNGAGDYRLTENAYNNVYAPAHNYPANLNLTPLAEFDPGNANQTSGGITFSSGSLSGTFTLAPGVDLGYYAVKAGNQFVLYEFTGTGTGPFNWSTADLKVGNGQQPGLSHIVFFGSVGNAVPEPATWAMMLLGIGMIGSGARRRRQKQSRSLVLS